MVITQLTTNGISERPDISGNEIVWIENSNDDSLILFDGTTSTVLPDLGLTLLVNPQISPDGVIWEGYSNRFQLFFYDGTNATQLTNAYSVYDEKLSGDRVAWRSEPEYTPSGELTEVFFYDGSTQTITQLTNNNVEEHSVDISGSNIVWSQGGIFLHDGTNTTLISSTGHRPFVSGDQVVWRDYSGGQASDIYLYDGNTTTQIVDSNNGVTLFGFFDGNVIWSEWDGNDWELFRFDGTNTLQITDNDFNDVFTSTSTATSRSYPSTVVPDGSGDNLVWSSYVNNSWEVFFYDGTQTIQVTDGGFNNYYPSVSGNKVVWHRDDGLATNIFLFEPDPAPEPVVFNDDFDPDIDNSQWQEIGNGVANANFGGSGNSLFFSGGTSGDNSRFATSKTLDLTAGGFITFELIFGDGTNGGEQGSNGEDVALEYSIDGGINWTELVRYEAENYTNWSNLVEAIPTVAQTTTTNLRWRQVSHDGANLDNWGLDNVDLLDAGTNFAPHGIDDTFSLDENSPNGTIVGTVTASDINVGQTLTYAILSGNEAGAFSIDSNGQISVIDDTLLDYETTPTFNLEIEVSDNGSPVLSDSMSITINLIDVFEAPTPTRISDDFDPNIDNSQWEEISNGIANTNFGDSGNSLFFSGGTSGDNSRFATSQTLNLTAGGFITFDLIFGTSSNGGENADSGEDVVLEYSTDTGVSWSQLALYDTEDYTSWSTLIEPIPAAAQTTATTLRWRQISHSGSSFDNWGLDNIDLVDAGTNFAPNGVDETFSLVENSPNGTVVGTVTASDPNGGQTLTYAILSGNEAGAFDIDSSGQINVIDAIPLDYETTPSFNLEIEVSDNGYPVLSDIFDVDIDLIDVYEGTVLNSLSDDFDPIIDNSQWSFVGNSDVNDNFGGDNNSLFFINGDFRDNSRQITTKLVDVANGGNISFDLIFGTSSNGGENADAGEDVVLQYSIDNGSSWADINLYDTEAYTSWTGINESIPVEAQSDETLFRWLQLIHSGSHFDNWGLDNILIESF